MLTKKINIVADDNIPFLKGVLEPYANIEYYPGNEISRKHIRNADALIIRTRTKCNKELLSNTNVKLIATATIGIDHIDVEYCEQNNIKLVNAPGCNSSSVMQYVTSALFYLAEREDFNLSPKTIGIIGVGNVGSKIYNVANILGMKVLLNDPPRARKEKSNRFVDIKTIQENADIITFHVPLNKNGIDKTYHLASESFFSSLKKKPIIINTSRGEVVDTNSIKNAIQKKKISKVVLDVWENEPSIDLNLFNMVTIGTPHIAGYSVEGKANGTAVCVNAVNDYFKLGLEENWYPINLPEKQSKSMTIDCSGKSIQHIISEAVFNSYDIINDDLLLRHNPQDFEKLRAEYGIRHEFDYYNLNLKSCSYELSSKLSQIGFNVM